MTPLYNNHSKHDLKTEICRQGASKYKIWTKQQAQALGAISAHGRPSIPEDEASP